MALSRRAKVGASIVVASGAVITWLINTARDWDIFSQKVLTPLLNALSSSISMPVWIFVPALVFALVGLVSLGASFSRRGGTPLIVKQPVVSPTSRGNLVVNDGQYCALDLSANVTDVLNAAIKDDKLHMYVSNNKLGVDPYSGKRKTLKVTYTYNGQVLNKVVAEDDLLELP